MPDQNVATRWELETLRNDIRAELRREKELAESEFRKAVEELNQRIRELNETINNIKNDRNSDFI